MDFRKRLLEAALLLLTILVAENDGAEKKPPKAVPKPLKVVLCSSLTAGVSDLEAKAFSNPMIDELAARLAYPISHIELCKSDTPEDLFSIADKINEGHYHVAAMSGIEYGWCREKYPRLEPLVVSQTAHNRKGMLCHVLVRQDFNGQRLSALRGKRLATYPGFPLMDRLFLEKSLRDIGAESVKDFFLEKECATAKEAINAVFDGTADCAAVNEETYEHCIANQPGVKLRRVQPCEVFPPAVLVGRADRIDKLRTGLWCGLRQGLKEINRTRKGRRCLDLWQQAGFDSPRGEFFRLVEELSKKYRP